MWRGFFKEPGESITFTCIAEWSMENALDFCITTIVVESHLAAYFLSRLSGKQRGPPGEAGSGASESTGIAIHGGV
jgi:hypothetical protein